jgi:hypothetical protein
LNAQLVPNWVKTKERPAIEIVADRDALDGLAEAVKMTLAAPLPLDGDTVTHEAEFEVAQLHPLEVEIGTDTEPPDAATVALVCAIENVHVVPPPPPPTLVGRMLT